jgi:O-antigen/teichoic acid export membrane protein
MGVLTRMKHGIINRLITRAVEKYLKRNRNMKNWKTTLLGIFGVLSAVGAAGTAVLDGNPATNLDIAVVIAAFAALFNGIGNLNAKDNDK